MAQRSTGSSTLALVEKRTHITRMPGSITLPEGQLSRRDKFRAYMQAFNPTAPARALIEAGLVYEDLHQSLYRNLAARADLEQGSRQLLVGGVGSGKTTELILPERWLSNQGHVLPIYVDTSAETDLSVLNPGALVASFGTSLCIALGVGAGARSYVREDKEGFVQTLTRLFEFAYGKRDPRTIDPASFENASEGLQLQASVGIPGKLKPPLPPLNRDIEEVRGPLGQLLAIPRRGRKEVIVVFDGLDRLLDATKFWSVVDQDLRLLRELGVSVIATAPLSVLLGTGVGQSISDHFERVHHLTAIASDPMNSPLMCFVLEKRSIGSLLCAGLATTIWNYSGGVLRDLISLARDAGEEAYVSDHDFISVADIEKVARQLGTGYLRGLGREAIETLLHLERTKSFDVSKPENVELLLTRRVLEYSSTDFRVHPALLSVIPRRSPRVPDFETQPFFQIARRLDIRGGTGWLVVLNPAGDSATGLGELQTKLQSVLQKPVSLVKLEPSTFEHLREALHQPGDDAVCFPAERDWRRKNGPPSTSCGVPWNAAAR